MDLLTAITAVWPLHAVHSMEPLSGGINNRTFRVHAESGDYILRLYPSSARREKIDFETRVLASLADAGLPFQVPAPLTAHSGEPAPLLRLDDQEPWALIVPVIPGAVRQPESPDQSCAVGAALGCLIKAMANVTRPPTAMGNYGDLEHVDPLLPDPIAAAELPIIESGQRKRLARLLEEMMTERQGWYSRLPQQVIHGDYVPFNLLMVGDRVSAVLDFELACHDLRAMDFAIGIWPWMMWGDRLNWEMGEAFSRGYTQHQEFIPAEAEALPFLLRLRRAGTLVWWAGRYLQGTADESAVQWAASSALKLEDWLQTNRDELIQRASRWAEPVTP